MSWAEIWWNLRCAELFSCIFSDRAELKNGRPPPMRTSNVYLFNPVAFLGHKFVLQDPGPTECHRGSGPCSCTTCRRVCSWNDRRRRGWGGWWKCRAWAVHHIRTTRRRRTCPHPRPRVPRRRPNTRWRQWSWPTCTILTARLTERRALSDGKARALTRWFYRRRRPRPPKR